jgi:drug/metabolite transporter (DMT)-like permease
LNNAKVEGNVRKAFGLLIVLGGANSVAVRISSLELAPFWGAAVRFMPSALIFWAVLFWKGIPVPRGKALEGAILYGVLTGFYYGLFYYGLVGVEAGLATVLLAITPLLTFFIAVMRGQEIFHWRGLFGGLISLAGVYLSVGGGLAGGTGLNYLAAVIGSGLILAIGTVLYKSYPQNHPLVTNSIALSMALVILLLTSWLLNEPWVLPQLRQTWLALAFIIPIGTVVVFFTYFYILDRWSASATSYSFLLFPFTATLFSAWLTGEEITGSFLLGGALVLLGVWVGVLSQEKLSRADI